MLFKLNKSHAELAVLRLNTDILDLPEVVIADGNAASDWTAFVPSPDGLDLVDEELVFAEYWTDQNEIIKYKKTRAKCAEVLVPHSVDSQYITGAFVSGEVGRRALAAAGFDLGITIDPHLFFQA